MDHFWNSKFATASVQLLNQERNNFASFVRTAVDLSLPPRHKPDSDLTEILNNLHDLYANTATDDDSNDMNASPGTSLSTPDPYVVAASELYSASFFGRQDPDAWRQRFLPIVAAVSKYRRGGATPNSKKTVPVFGMRFTRSMASLLVRQCRRLSVLSRKLSSGSS